MSSHTKRSRVPLLLDGSNPPSKTLALMSAFSQPTATELPPRHMVFPPASHSQISLKRVDGQMQEFLPVITINRYPKILEALSLVVFRAMTFNRRLENIPRHALCLSCLTITSIYITFYHRFIKVLAYLLLSSYSFAVDDLQALTALKSHGTP